MQIIIEIKNAGKFNRLLELIRQTEWLSGVRVWKKASEQAKIELVIDRIAPVQSSNSRIDYRDFWGCIQPQMGILTVDRLIAEMRED
ncbi:MAG: hypothetical protein IPM82_07975 [Saprospiraceae bacterium]|nr:hypothetical protein [Saprospiraceae bacterium]